MYAIHNGQKSLLELEGMDNDIYKNRMYNTEHRIKFQEEKRMLRTVVQKGSYHDSVVLMLLTNHISAIEGVKKVSIMMATPANKDIFKQSGLDTEELMSATANDMVVVADVDDEGLLDVIMAETEEFFKKQSTDSDKKKGAESVKSWDKALKKMPDANLAVISIPGAYAALEADRALDEGLNVFMFSDNDVYIVNHSSHRAQTRLPWVMILASALCNQHRKPVLKLQNAFQDCLLLPCSPQIHMVNL